MIDGKRVDMDSFLPGFLQDLGWQFPTIIVCLMGIYLAFERMSQQPQSARRALFGFGLLLLTNIASSALNRWLVGSMNAPDANLAQLQGMLAAVSFVIRLAIALSLWLLLRAIFPALPGTVSPSWGRYLIGIFLGLVLGGVLGAVLGDPLSQAMGISNFEGGRGYFVIFILIPGFALAGALIGGIVVRMMGGSHT